MIKKLTRHGNSTAVIIDKALLKVLNITPETELKISTNGESIIITPVREASLEKISENKIIQNAVEEVMKKYAPALKKLAKN